MPLCYLVTAIVILCGKKNFNLFKKMISKLINLYNLKIFLLNNINIPLQKLWKPAILMKKYVNYFYYFSSNDQIC